MSARVSQAGGIVFRKEDDRLVVLLVRSKKDPGIWVFPKGHVESHESAEQTAIRETWEEAGVEAELAGPAGEPLEFQSGDEAVTVQYFVLRARTERPSPEARDKQWVSIGDAVRMLAFDTAREKLREAARLIAQRAVFSS